MGELPPHVATADEPIPEPSARPSWNEPDMRKVTPLEQMLAELAHVSDDDGAFVQRLVDFVTEIGCSLVAHYARDGEMGFTYHSPVDAQIRHRSRWMHFLVGRLDAVETRREHLFRFLVDRRAVWDERPVDPRETTAALRGFLQAGGRILIHPAGRLEEGGCHEAFSLTNPDADTIAEAARRYFAMRFRFRADRQIRRAVRMLGQSVAGWQVLEARRG